MSPVRIGAAIGGTTTLLLLLFKTRFPWSDGVAWFFAVAASGLVAVYGAAVVRTVLKIINVPRSWVAPVIFLSVLSGLRCTRIIAKQKAPACFSRGRIPLKVSLLGPSYAAAIVS